MKLTAMERKAVEMLRRLDVRQRAELLGEIAGQVTANRLVSRAVGLRKMKIVDNKRIEKAFGAAPIWRSKRVKL